MSECINCKSDLIGTGLRVKHDNTEIGMVCDNCLIGVNGLRLFIKKQPDGTLLLQELQIVPNPR